MLIPGFHAQNGSAFLAKIDSDNDVNTNARKNRTVMVDDQKDFEEIRIIQNAYVQNIIGNSDLIPTVYPNPFTDNILIEVGQRCSSCEVEIHDMLGNTLFRTKFRNTNQVNINELDFLSPGMYFLKVNMEGNILIASRIVKATR